MKKKKTISHSLKIAINCLAFIAIALLYYIIDGNNIVYKWKVGFILSFVALAFSILGRDRRYEPFVCPATIFPMAIFLIYSIGSYRWAIEGFTEASMVPFSAAIAIILFSSGYSVASTISLSEKKRKVGSLPSWDQSPRLRLACYSLLTISLMAVTFFIAKVGVPVLRSDGLTYRFLAREQVSSYVMTMIRAMQLPLYIFLALTLVKYPKLPKTKIALFVFLAVAVLIINAAPGWRNPLMFIFLNIVFIFSIARPQASSFGLFLVLAGASILMLGFGFGRLVLLSTVASVDSINYFRTFSNSWVEIFFLWASHQFSVYSFGFISAVSVFPEQRSYFFGSILFITLKTILPGRDQTVGQMLKEWLNLDFAGGGLNLSLLGESYADFGVFGIILYPFLYGFILGRMMKLVSTYRNPTFIALAAFIGSSFAMGCLTGVLALSSFWILGIILVLLIIPYKIDSNSFSRRLKNHE